MNNAMIIPNCYHSTSISIERRKSKVLLFVGHLGYPPNVEAIDYFYKNIFAKMPADFRFRIVGKKPTNRIYHSLLDTIASDPRVELHYDVISCSPFYQDVFAAVVPLLQGSGTRLKILEAFAHRCPIISTSKGCEGHNVRDGVHLLIRDEVEDFALACEQLYRDDRLAASLAEAGLSFLKENNSQQALEELLYKQIDSQIPSLRKEQINGKFFKHNSIEWNSCTEAKVV